MKRSLQWLICAAILFVAGVGLIATGIFLGIGPSGVGFLLLATGVGAVLIAMRFRKLERAEGLSQLEQQMDRFW